MTHWSQKFKCPYCGGKLKQVGVWGGDRSDGISGIQHTRDFEHEQTKRFGDICPIKRIRVETENDF